MNNKISNLSAMIGAAFVASAALSPLASAAEAGFSSTNLQAGYTLADNHATKSDGEHKCGEAKCGADKKAEGEHKCGEAKCGADKKAEGEGKCGEGKCGADKKAAGEGKCGEGKCGAEKKAE
jgi:uncharacterized low-complexity protein